MPTSIEQLARDLRAFDGRKEVVKQLKGEIRKPLPEVRKAIRRRALDTLPKRGGLNRWVARTRVLGQVRVTGRGVEIKLVGRRKSQAGTSDLKRLDRGRIRHPTFGQRGKGMWHTQAVRPGYFTDPAAEIDQWREAVERACAEAVKTIGR